MFESEARTLQIETNSVSDVPRDGVQPWTETTSARERVRAVAETLREPRSTNWISEQAGAAWSTTDEELQELVSRGWLHRIEAGRTTLYQPDYTRLLFDEIRILIEENTREELRDELIALREGTEGRQETYTVDTWEELERTLADAELSSAEISERRDAVAFWRENEADRQLIKHALALYSDVEAARERAMDTGDRATS